MRRTSSLWRRVLAALTRLVDRRESIQCVGYVYSFSLAGRPVLKNFSSFKQSKSNGLCPEFNLTFVHGGTEAAMSFSNHRHSRSVCTLCLRSRKPHFRSGQHSRRPFGKNLFMTIALGGGG